MTKGDVKTGKSHEFRMRPPGERDRDGCETRNIAVDDRRGDIWVPCFKASKVARLQFRTVAEVQALKAASSAARR